MSTMTSKLVFLLSLIEEEKGRRTVKAGLHFGEEEREGEGDADKKAAEAAITNPLMSKLRKEKRGGEGRGRDTNGKFPPPPSLEMQLQGEMEGGFYMRCPH